MTDTTKAPPADFELERHILGAVLLEPSSFAHAQALEPEDFFVQDHSKIYGAMRDLWNAGTPIAHMDVALRLEREGHGEARRRTLPALIDGIPAASAMPRMVDSLRELSTRRQMIRRMSQAIANSTDQEHALPEVIADVEMQLEELRARLSTSTTDVRPPSVRLREALQAPGGTGIDLGWNRLNAAMYGGLDRGYLMVIGAKGGTGKTQWSLQTCEQVAWCYPEEAVVYFSLEMPGPRLIGRMMQAYCGVGRNDLGPMLSGAVPWPGRTAAEFDEHYRNLVVIDEDGMTVPDMLAVCAGIERRISLVVVDFLQRIKVPGAKSRYDRASDAVEGVKTLARRTNAAVILLSQLSREIPNHWTPPTLSSFRDSGNIEDQGDVVIGLWRPDYEEEQKTRPSETNLQAGILKNKDGWTGRIPYRFELAHQRIREVPRTEDEAHQEELI